MRQAVDSMARATADLRSPSLRSLSPSSMPMTQLTVDSDHDLRIMTVPRSVRHATARHLLETCRSACSSTQSCRS